MSRFKVYLKIRVNILIYLMFAGLLHSHGLWKKALETCVPLILVLELKGVTEIRFKYFLQCMFWVIMKIFEAEPGTFINLCILEYFTCDVDGKFW